MQSVQEENVLLKRAVEQTPSDMNKLSRQISTYGACVHVTMEVIPWNDRYSNSFVLFKQATFKQRTDD